ncbi:iron-sulfur cluster co-chaperone HscB C-terminal domain-containing protein [Candidatus Fokinia crypta]|nr:iron-sulfur cluster co-chaperone HscB C-terminal domain-containing protein [Candidatus Fokinia cryptica]
MNIKCGNCGVFSYDIDICSKCEKVIQIDDKMVVYKDTSLENIENKITFFNILDITELEAFSNEILLLKCNQKQEKFHPDKHTLASQDEKLTAIHRASICNIAFITLSNFVSRVEYILQIHKIEEVVDNSIINYLFIMNTKLEESNNEEIAEITKEIESKIISLMNSITQTITLLQYNNVSKYLIELRYLIKMKKKCT